MDEVRDLLGDPIRQNIGETTVEWVYYYKLRQTDVVRFLGVLRVRKNRQVWERNLRVLFENEKVIAFTEKSRPSTN
jgi:outer membrane protein assembly factor BamE (lipoprotein component of BamABCDE complex)